MKIAQIICVYPPYGGGMGATAKIFSDLLLKNGHKVTNFTPKYKNKSVKENNYYGNNLVQLEPVFEYGNAAIIPSLYSFLDNFNIVIFHYPFFGADLIMVLKLLFGKKNYKFVIFYHMDVLGDNIFVKSLIFLLKGIRGFLFKNADLIAVSTIDYARSGDIAGLYNEYMEKFVEIPFAVDIRKFAPAESDKQKEVLQLLFVGGLDRQHYFKGIDFLIDSLAMIKNGVVSEWRLKIVGSGNLIEQYRAQADKLGLKDKIIFAGNIADEEKIKAYQESDIFVLPSINKNEAFGLVLLEAMACGVPVIASRLSGVRQVFKDGMQGYYVEPGDKNDLSEKILKLLKDPALRNKMGREARRLAEEKYSEEKLSMNLEDAINKTFPLNEGG